MDSQSRETFDLHLEHVLARLPESISTLLDKVPMIVEDYPSDALLRQLGLHSRRQLCGLYTGIPLSNRSIQGPAVPSDVIQIFREGILSQTRYVNGQVTAEGLQEQIRITILHELGHHFGMTEEDLDELGYG
ncbi:metallopeptidase family protein [Bremerella sp. T1]|uniref:metallopeptidase family protein n=1 Tax=Bremerella sp. TYQ1 TaxID=3119568 RepID=UPI001CCD6013|nr:metallopeptidase family protein [Bremerella volcania]UBM36576.1 metallopeptidase family protein [Bremerella volcania]